MHRIIALAIACIAATAVASAQDLHAIRVAKCRYVVRHAYYYGDERDFLPYCEYLVTYHEQLERDACAKGKPASGYGAAWWYSLVYGGANFSLKCYRRAPGRCVGPLDVKGKPGSIDPKRNIQYHCQEMLTGYLAGYRGLGLCRYVMLPARPTDWGGGMFAKTDARLRAVLAAGYRDGEVRR